MELAKISIWKYRSIEHIEIRTDDRCKIFIGINETGKSNILNALAAISNDFEFDYSSDAKLPVEEPYKLKDPRIRYTFRFSLDEKTEILKETFGHDVSSWPILLGRYGLAKFADNLIGDHSYEIILKKDGSKKTTRYYNLDEDLIKPKANVFAVSEQISPDIMNLLENHKVPISEHKWIDLSVEQIASLKEVKPYLKAVDFEAVKETISSATCDYMDQHLPGAIYWKYDDSLLLAEPVGIDEFKQNPDISVPLKSIFSLAGIDNIQERLEDDMGNDSALHNLLERLSDVATKHIRSIWKDYKGLEIVVKQRPKKFSVLVHDKRNLYNFRQRSDGFKRFISFLLMLSARHRCEELPQNTIIIMDEPDISLHPSGVRHLLKEVLRISENTYFFVATHSLFFIDKDNIGRHYIVDKENENTLIKQANYQNFSEEEVLFNALGFSVFDILKNDNLLFEGWTDKEVFKIMFNLYREDISNSHLLEDLGICWSSGVSKMCETIRPLLWDGERYFLLVADNDGPGLKEQKKFSEKFSKEFPDNKSQFRTYKELSNKRAQIVTLEDLLPREIMIEVLNKHLRTINSSPPKRFTQSNIKGNGVIKSWEAFCSKYYSPQKSSLVTGYKNTIPKLLGDYLEKNKTNTTKVKEHFVTYRTFIEKMIQTVEKVRTNP